MRILRPWTVALSLLLFSWQDAATAQQMTPRESVVNALLNTTVLTSHLPVLDLQTRDSFLLSLRDTVPDTVPEGVECTKIQRCDSKKVCVITCERGSVVVDPWLRNALRLQRKLAYKRSFCNAHLPGSHNSAISIADGYGVEDHVFEMYMKYIPWVEKHLQVHTNDQLFTLTDQLNMGVRFIELDVHWFDNDLRIAHCGGFHSGLLDGLISAFNVIARWLGTDIEWDSATIGCKPSLSSIPAKEQRRLVDGLVEIATWLHAPENKDEFLLVFFDDENNLYRWKKVRTLLQYIREHFDEKEVLLPADLVLTKGWPSFQSLIDGDKRVIFMSGSNYSPRADEVLFVKENICNWTEPGLPFYPYPECVFDRHHVGPLDHRKTIFRPETSEIVYGFLNADGHFGGNEYLLNETTIPPMVECGVNIPSPDNITPRRIESMVWALTRPNELTPGKCVGITRESETWTSVDCDQAGFVATCAHRSHYTQWHIGKVAVAEKDANASCATLPGTLAYRAPTNGFENKLIHSMLTQASPEIQGVWVNAKALVSAIFSVSDSEHVSHPLQQLDDVMVIE